YRRWVAGGGAADQLGLARGRAAARLGSPGHRPAGHRDRPHRPPAEGAITPPTAATSVHRFTATRIAWGGSRYSPARATATNLFRALSCTVGLATSERSERRAAVPAPMAAGWLS